MLLIGCALFGVALGFVAGLVCGYTLPPLRERPTPDARPW